MKKALLRVKPFLIAFLFAAVSCVNQPGEAISPQEGGATNQNPAAAFAEAEQAFEKGIFQKAYASYEIAYKGSADAVLKLKSLFRMCESLTHLFRYGEAARLLLETPLPDGRAERSRVFLLKVGLLQSFLRQYSYLLASNEKEETSSSGGVFRLTRSEGEAEIEKAFQGLAALKDTLKGMPLKDEGYYFQIENVDFNMFPTLYDFFIQRRTDHLLFGRSLSENDLLVILNGEKRRTDEPGPVMKAADLMAEAASFTADQYPEAAEYWRVKRLTRLLDLSWDVPGENAEKALRLKAVTALEGMLEKLTRPGPRALAAFNAARLLNSPGTYVRALALCDRILKEFPGAPSAADAKALRRQILNPFLSLRAETLSPHGPQTVTVTTRNVNRVFFRAYQLRGAELAQAEDDPDQLYSLSSGSINDDEGLGKRIFSRTPDLSWDAATNDPGAHEYMEVTAPTPRLAEGMHLIVACHDASFIPGSTLWCAGLVNVTSLVLVATPGASLAAREAASALLEGKGGDSFRDGIVRYYAFDAETGKPARGASIIALWGHDERNRRRTVLTTGPLGAVLELPVSVRPGVSTWYSVTPLAKRGPSYSYLAHADGFWHQTPGALEFFVTTDRPIYRPGDTLTAKITGVRRTSGGYRALDRDFSVTVQARDPNGNVIFDKRLPLNQFGSCHVSFTIPKGKLLGAYSLTVSAAAGLFTGSGNASFRVEEYKRPEFEIVFDKNANAFRFGKPAELTGAVRYYFGGAAVDADVEYTVTYSLYVPWYFRYWFYGSFRPQTRITASGKIKTDERGRFRIVFTPRASDLDAPAWMQNGLAPEIASYDVTVSARDAGGRTITASAVCRAARRSYYFTAEADKGFYFKNDTITLNAGKLSVNDEPLSGEASYTVHSLEKPAIGTGDEKNLHADRSGGMDGDRPGPELELMDAKNNKLVASGTLSFGADGAGRLTLRALAPGAYRLTLKGKDEDGEVIFKKIFIVAGDPGKESPLPLDSITLFEKNEYTVGDTARLLIGSRFGGGACVMELWAGGFFIKSLLIDDTLSIRTVSIPVTADMKGGFTVRWFCVKGLNVLYGQASAAVPWGEKNLSIALEPFKGILLPGEKASWGVKIKTAEGRPAPAEVLVFMYDRSLEYYASSSGRSYGSLYLPNPAPHAGITSDFTPRIFASPVRQGPLYDQLYNETRLTEAVLPGFRTDRTAIYRGTLKLSDAMMPEAVPPPAPAAGESTGAEMEEGEAGVKAEKPPAPPMPAVQARASFADTAFFLPHLTTDKKGEVRFSFTAPEQLTGWRIKVAALTTDVSWGERETEAVTKKELMVRLDLPRFFREKDKGTLTAVVHNESDRPLSGRVWIDVLDNGNSMSAAWKLSDRSKTFMVNAHGQTTFDWPVEIPAGIGGYTVRAVAAAEATGTAAPLRDAEERALPVLPSRQRLIESAFAVLRGSETKSIAIPAAVDPTRINESITLEIDPQLALTLLNTIPFLIDYPYSCVEQTLNKYVPLAIVNEIYGKYPEVRKAVAALPKRTTVTLPWDEKDPLRRLTLDETPWGWEAKGRPSALPIIDLLDPSLAAAQKERVFAELKASQLPSGAFPWWQGGREDLYMTLYVLTSLAEARRYGVALDTDMVNRALHYVNAAIPQNEPPEPSRLALIAYASYAVTSFPVSAFSEAARGFELARKWVDFLYDRRFALTPFGKGYLASVYFRLGDAAKGDELLAMALDGAREDPVTGVYWTPEAYSWLWYSDTVEKHAFFLKTLLDWKPDDKRIDGMARWLLWNRKGNVWKSTKASAAALFSLLEYLAKGGALLADEQFTVDWGTAKETARVKADAWHDKALRFRPPETDVGPVGPSVSVSKEGRATSFASLTWIYSTDQLPPASGPGLIQLTRRFFLRVKDRDGYRLKEIMSGETVAVGDQIEVKMTLTAKSAFEYMHLKDPKAAGFESETLLSGWKYDPLWYYEETRDSSTNFFLDWIPHGEYVLRYRLRPTKPGEYRIGAATLQSMYSPDLNAHSDGFLIKVKK